MLDVDAAFRWSAWHPLEGCWHGQSVPPLPGLYRIRCARRDELAYIGEQTGLLALMGELSADRSTLRYALEGVVENPDAAIERLLARGVLVERAFSSSFALWEGSDVDIEARLREAATHIAAEPVRALARYLPARPVVARRHSIQTGTLRFFNVAYVADLADLERVLQETSSADGMVLLFVRAEAGVRRDEVRETLNRLRAAAERPVLLAVLDQPTEVREIIAHIERLEWVRTHTPALAGDPVARREIDARRQLADARLRAALGGGRVGDAVRAFAPAASWYDERGEPVRILSERSLNEFLSQVCRRTYPRTPEITNELMNRRTLSSAAAKAQRILLEAMVEARTEARLGIEGAPPQLSMYYSVLEKPGLHVETEPGSGVYRYTDLRAHPDPSWQGLGAAVDELLGGSSVPVSLEKVIRAWTRRPFGLKNGVLPVLLAQVLLSREDELALYEGDMFVPELSVPVIERIAKIPQTFSIRSIPSSGLTEELVQELVPLLRQASGNGGAEDRAADLFCGVVPGGRPGLLQVIRPWVQFVATLPEITQSTQHLSPETAGLRDVILRTADPLKLLFEDLPRLFGVEPRAEPEAFAARVHRAMRELRSHYDPRVLDEIHGAIVRAVGENANEPNVRTQIATRALALYEVVTEHRLKAFLFRLSEDRTPRNAWCESVASMVAQRPPSKWHDDDLKTFHVEVGALGRRMRSAEAAAFDTVPTRRAGRALGGGARHVHLSATTATGHQYADVVRIPAAQAATVVRLGERLIAWLQANVDDADLRKAVLAQGWQEVLMQARQSTDNVTGAGD
ncbi:MAG: hypothetical protein H0X65_08915 [Gemmatimonadetes bacterium]|nr:hypothetical protein [Gemmatimonadota bacterium]